MHQYILSSFGAMALLKWAYHVAPQIFIVQKNSVQQVKMGVINLAVGGNYKHSNSMRFPAHGAGKQHLFAMGHLRVLLQSASYSQRHDLMAQYI